MKEEAVIYEEKKKFGFFTKFFFILLVFILLLISYMYFIEPKLCITHEVAIVEPSLPDSFNGFKIVQFSDIHFGRTTNEVEVKNVVQEINLTKPDLLVFTGDLFDSYINLSDDNVRFLKEELSKTTATIGKYAIRGDSDYLHTDKFEEIMQAAGFTILDNLNIPIYYKDTTPIYLSGIPSVTQGEQDFTKAFTKEMNGNFFQILLTHEPIIWKQVQSKTNLVLAGHSLGGLVRIPFVGDLIKKDNVGDYVVGKFENGNSIMYVSNGIGTENLSLRFLNIPSITLYRLYNYE